MTDFDRNAFFTLHADLPREGPGEPADVAWAAQMAGVTAQARILDAACGPGGDIAALLAAAPQGHVTGIDLHAPFIAAARAQWHNTPRVTLLTGDMTTPQGIFDFIWCAGAVYFLGIEAALTAWRGRLAPGGAIAFSEPCFFTDAPSDGARAFWDGEGHVGTEDDIAKRIAAVGYKMMATRRLSSAAWEAYYKPQAARIAKLRPTADATLSTVLDTAEREATLWRTHKTETGYVLIVVHPG